LLKHRESAQVAVYFLIGDADEGGEPSVYIGQTGDLRARLVKHNKEKDYWERAAILISRTNSLPQPHALFLEWYCLQAVRKAGRYQDENGNSGTKPHTPAPLEADCLEIYETGHTLLATLGFPLFDPVVKSDGGTGEEIFYCTAAGTNGRGIYTPEGFVVFEGSIGRRENVQSIKGQANERFRIKLIESGVMVEKGDTVVFQKDHLFNSPSMAAVALVGASANGWLYWKTKDGQTLDFLKRQST